jgi:integrase/recombinase XerD
VNFQGFGINFLDYRDLFFAHIAIEKGLSSNTLEAYRRDLSGFYNFVGENGLDLNHEAVKTYLQSISGAVASRDRQLSTLKSYFKFLINESLIDYDPTSTLHSKNRIIRLPKSLSFDQINQLIDICNNSTPAGIRDEFLLELLYGTGMRISEATSLDLDDVDTTNGWIKIRFAKGSKQRIVPIGSKLRESLDKYLIRVRADLIKANRRESALILSLRGKRITRQAAWQIIKALGEKANLESQLSPHALRHSFATHLLAGGADIRVVQELLGHSVVTTTQIYTKVNIDQVRETFLSSHPRAR